MSNEKRRSVLASFILRLTLLPHHSSGRAPNACMYIHKYMCICICISSTDRRSSLGARDFLRRK